MYSQQSEPLYKLQRRLRKQERGFRNRVRSLLRDAAFVDAVCRTRFPGVPIILNARAGNWYHPAPVAHSYFKSTDGHPGTWAFALTRLNLHVASLAASARGAVIVDASQSHKRFPDALSRTVPLWAAVINHVVLETPLKAALLVPFSISPSERDSMVAAAAHAVAVMSPETRATIVKELAPVLTVPLRCVWLDQTALGVAPVDGDSAFACSDSDDDDAAGRSAALPARVPFNAADCSTEAHFRAVAAAGDRAVAVALCRGEGHDASSAAKVASAPRAAPSDHIPLILLSASTPAPSQTDACSAREGWTYLPGAGDDHEAWARGLTPEMFWRLLPELLACDDDADVDALIARSSSDASAGGAGSGSAGVSPTAGVAGAAGNSGAAGSRGAAVPHIIAAGCVQLDAAASAASLSVACSLSLLCWRNDVGPTDAEATALAANTAASTDTTAPRNSRRLVLSVAAAASIEALKADVDAFRKGTAAGAAADASAAVARPADAVAVSTAASDGGHASTSAVAEAEAEAAAATAGGHRSWVVPVGKKQFGHARGLVEHSVLPQMWRSISMTAAAAAAAAQSAAAAGAASAAPASITSTSATDPAAAAASAAEAAAEAAAIDSHVEPQPQLEVVLVYTPGSCEVACTIAAVLTVLLEAGAGAGSRTGVSAAATAGEDSGAAASGAGKDGSVEPAAARKGGHGDGDAAGDTAADSRDDIKALKTRLRAAVASAQVRMGNGCVPKDVQQEVWRFLARQLHPDASGAGAGAGGEK